MPLLVVAVALIDGDGRVLLQQRKLGSEHGGLWEFPGGKIESGESPVQATVREIGEELGVRLDPAALDPVGFAADITGSGRPVVMLLYGCRNWQGEPECRVAEALAWFDPAHLESLAMPPLDVPLIGPLHRALGLPSRNHPTMCASPKRP